MNNFIKKQKGITLIALVITIIVLLILAGVAISMLSGENGILKQAAEAKTETEKQSTLEQIKLGAVTAVTNTKHRVESETSLKLALEQQDLKDVGNPTKTNGGYLVTIGEEEYRISNIGEVNLVIKLEGNQGKILNKEENTAVKDEYGNIIMVPAGFAILTGDTANNAAKGLVITDKVNETTGASEGNEFVWIPVGDVYTDEAQTEANKKTITMARYLFNNNGSVNETLSKTEASAQLKTSSTASYYYTDPEVAEFKTSAIKNGGYYIGRYEAGDADAIEARSSATDGTLVCKANQQVYNYIKRSDAITKSQQMYNNSNFTSDLSNSFAWDTAIVFIQTMSNSYDYAKQGSLNTGSLITTGTSGDSQYNIYDMASNVFEWSTENWSYSGSPCVYRGGDYSYRYNPASARFVDSDRASAKYAFRPILYM